MLDLVQGLPERGIDVHVALQTPGPLAERLDLAGIGWTPIRTHRWIGVPRGGPLRRVRNRVLDFATVRRLAPLAKALGAAFVHTNTLSSPVGGLIARRASLPHVWHMREAVDTDPGSAFLEGWDPSVRLLQETAHRVFVVSHYLAQQTARYAPSDRIRVLHNGPLDPQGAEAPLEARRPIHKDGPIRLLLVGSISLRKGQREAIEALALLRAEGLDARLSLAGDGASHIVAEYKARARELGVAEAVEWLGYVDPREHYARCDLSLLAGPGDPLPRVAIESLANGVPTVALRSGGIPEIIDDGETGWLYDGTAESLAAAIRQALDETSDRREEMRQEGRRRAYARFNMNRYRDDCVTLYREMGMAF